MKLRSMMVAALAALTLASCSKDGENDGGQPVDETTETTFGFSITLPQGLKTRATQDATAEESFIGDDIYVYVFDRDGSLTTPPSGGSSFEQFSLSGDFTQTSPGTYLLQDSKKMRTYAGSKTIYVAVNLESSALSFATSAPADEAALLAAISVHDDLINRDAQEDLESIVMIGRTEARLAMAEYDNVVDVELERSVSRVIATTDETTLEFTADWKAASAQDFKVKLTGFFVVQDAHTSHFAQKYNALGNKTSYISTASNWESAINRYAHYAAAANRPIDYADIKVDASTRQTFPGFYIGENVANNENDVARYGSATYAYIQTQLTLTNSAVIVDNAGQDEISYTGAPIAPGTDFVLIRSIGYDDIICENDPTVITEITDFLQTEHSILNSNINTYLYEKAYIYYRVFLNKDETGYDKYNVYRNQFINVGINGINITPGDFGKSYPGEEGDPETPIDPNEDNGKNPNPPEDEDETPLTEEEATLRVSISVKPWEYKTTDLSLGGDEK